MMASATSDKQQQQQQQLQQEDVKPLDGHVIASIIPPPHNGDASAPPPPPPPPLAEKVSFAQLFQFASFYDFFLMIFGSLCAAVTGCSLPLVTIVFGDIIQALIQYPYSGDKITLNSKVNTGVIYLAIIGAATFVCAYLQMALWSLAGQNQTVKIRRRYLQAVMRQEVAWFDENEIGSITSRLTDDITLIRDGMGEKIAAMIQFLTMFLAGYVIGFTHSWKLTLVMMSTFPLMAGCAVWLSSTVSAGSTKTQSAYAKAGAIAQQVIAGVRTVVSFGREDSEVARYNQHLDDAEKFGIRKGWGMGLGMGCLTGCMFLSYSLGFWYGAILISNGEMEVGSVVSVFFSVLIGAFALGQAGPGFTALSNSRGAAVQIYKIIKRKSAIDHEDPSGQPLTQINQSIEFKKIGFAYPKRPEVTILEGFDLTIKAGQTVALVGSSGSGKSTIVKLIERFYDPVSGSISIDDQDIKSFNVKSLRQAIAIVSQEPVLFDLTIRDNILLGLKSDGFDSESSQQQLDDMVVEACKTANIWEFVQSLPHGINTSVGEAGSMMSGGQKQRIAIARAVIRNPLILLLDEATSALDTESERLVQKALENASVGRTTIVIAHRMSTIKNADVIVVMDKGKIVEMGSHGELVDLHGKYFELVEKQSLKTGAVVANGVDNVDDVNQNDGYSPKSLTGKGEEKNAEETVLVLGDPLDGKNTQEIIAVKNTETNGTTPADQSSKTVKGYTRLMRLAAPEWPWILIGSVAAALNGMVNPSFALIFSHILNDFGQPKDVVQTKANFWSGMFVLIAGGSFVTHLLKDGCLRYAGEKFTRRLRENYLRAILHQNMSYFDVPEHATGAITARLAEELSQIQTLTSVLLGSIIVMFSSLTTGIAIAFSQSWELSLVVIGVIPLIGIGGAVQLKSLAGFGAIVSKAYAEVNRIATEAISEYRTILTLTKESHFIKRYTQGSASPHAAAVKGGFVAAVGFGFSQCVQFFAFALALWYGTKMVIDGKLDDKNGPLQVMSVIFAIIFAALAAGESTTFLPSIGRAHIAATEYFKLIDAVPTIDSKSNTGHIGSDIKGEVGVKSATFTYPARPDIVVWNGLSIEAHQGKTVALVGKSGCGKSTAIAIVERFYDVDSGCALFDDVDVKDWNLRFMRRQMALVGQEPVLFNASIYDNIAYGLPNDVVCTAELVEGAARMANIHEFVTSLPQGYDTIVGEKGGQISGGQKQRIAIARALIRNPKVLLLDEATSALDSDSEKIVQEALDKAAAGRTTIVIAHRLSTIQNADVIFVLDSGYVVEAGTHDELVARGGKYSELVNKQK